MNSGHMICGMLLGLKIQRLNIMPIGFAVSFKIDINNYNKKIVNGSLLTVKKLIITLAGPMVNVILIIGMLLSKRNMIFNIETSLLIYTNVLIFMFNMIMIYPLDGGRILKHILHIFFGRAVSLKYTNIISNIMAIILTIIVTYISIIYCNIAYFFVLVYIWVLVIKENKVCKMKLRMYEILKEYK